MVVLINIAMAFDRARLWKSIQPEKLHELLPIVMPIYRAANSTDADRIALLHADSWRRTYRGILSDKFLDRDVVDNRLEVWHDRLGVERKEQFVIVAEDGDRIIGFICIYGNEDPQ